MPIRIGNRIWNEKLKIQPETRFLDLYRHDKETNARMGAGTGIVHTDAELTFGQILTLGNTKEDTAAKALLSFPETPVLTATLYGEGTM